MKRLVIITVGKTHSGKTTFAQALSGHLQHSLVIDQDTHAEFINAYYKCLLPKHGPNTLKHAITQTIVDYAVYHTGLHLILCNSNRVCKGRLDLLEHFHEQGFIRILVHFDIPDHVLRERVSASQRSTAILRSASSFEELLNRQQAESYKADVAAPTEGEADFLFVIKNTDDVQSVTRSIVTIAQRL